MLINNKKSSDNYLLDKQITNLADKNRVFAEEKFDVTKHAVVCLPNLSEIKSAIADFEAEDFPLYKISLIGLDIPQLEDFTGIAISDRLNATALSIPQEKADFYYNCIEQRQYLIVISASDREMNKALSILEKTGIRHWRIYDQTQLVRY